MHPLESVLLLLPIIACFFFATQVYFYNRKRKHTTLKYLLLYLINSIIYSFFLLFIVLGHHAVMGVFLPLFPLVIALKAPLLFIYIDDILSSSSRSKAVTTYRVHFIVPCLVFIVTCITFFGLLNPTLALEFIQNDFESGIFRLNSYDSDAIATHYVYLGISIVFFFTSLFYAGLVQGLIPSHSFDKSENHSVDSRRYIYIVGFLLLLSPLTILIINIVNKSLILDSTLLVILLTIPSTCIIYYMCYTAMHEPIVRETMSVDQVNSLEKNANELFDELLIQLDRVMSHEKPYLKPSLTLSDLAKMLNTNNTILSRLFNNNLNTNFRKYLNKHRAEEATRLVENDTQRLTLTEISEKAGFNSYDTFSRTFSELYGTKPSMYFSKTKDKSTI